MDKIALITDIHANLEALKAVLEDLKAKNIEQIYSLGDAIGLGYDSSAVLDLLMENNVINILGNSEAYVTMGVDYFPYLKHCNEEKYYNALWTISQLNSKQLDYLRKCVSSIIINYNGKRIGLCHFPLDIRYDFPGVWKYDGKRAQVFFKTNTDDDMEKKNPNVLKNVEIASLDPLFNGETLDNFDWIIYGHYHFEREHFVNGVRFNSLNGSGVAISDKAVYYVIENNNGEVVLTRYDIPYDYEKVYNLLDQMDFPNKKTFCKYIGK